VTRLGAAPDEHAPPGVRVVLDARALQEPARAPLTAAYLDGLLGAFDAEPVAGESFAFLLASDEDDPTARYANLEVVGRRLLPPTRLLRSTALTIDPFVLRGASIGAGWRAERGGAAGAVYHAIGAGLPIASGLPVVATLLDLAPWELPAIFQRAARARFGYRLRARLVRDAAAVIVGTDAVATSARRLLHLRRDRIRVVPLAPRPAITLGSMEATGAGVAAGRVAAARYGLSERYFVYTGRYDARQDLATLARALAALASGGRPAALPAAVGWPPRVLLLDATPDDRAAFARTLARHEIGDALAYAPRLPVAETVALIRGARAALLPVLADSNGLAAIEAIASGVPVIASSVGALPEIVGTAGILVEPRDPERLAVALAAAWSDEVVHDRISAAAATRARGDGQPVRTWRDVAAEVRSIYADVSRPGRL
jgi:glycosyltransferase involved in cell wall biosynthesis